MIFLLVKKLKLTIVAVRQCTITRAAIISILDGLGKDLPISPSATPLL